LPLHIKSGFITATANCNNVTTDCNVNYDINSANSENRAQNSSPEGNRAVIGSKNGF
jgi:hypothetical protein